MKILLRKGRRIGRTNRNVMKIAFRNEKFTTNTNREKKCEKLRKGSNNNLAEELVKLAEAGRHEGVNR